MGSRGNGFIPGGAAVRMLERLLLIGGLGLFAYLLYDLGAASVLTNLRVVGWGIVPIVLQEILAFLANTAGWRLAFPKPAPAVPFVSLLGARIAGDAVNYLTPTATFGGELVRGRMLGGHAPTVSIVASLAVAKLTQTIGLLAFVAIGVGVALNRGLLSPSLQSGLFLGLGAFTAVLAFLLLLLRHGLFTRLFRFAQDRLGLGGPPHLGQALQRLDRELAARGDDTAKIDEMIDAVRRLEEDNPMMGLRGVRLGMVRPELYRAQVRAALAAVARRLDAGGDPHLEIMIPLVSTVVELERMGAMIHREMAAAATPVDVPVGTMIEVPRAALRAAEMARYARFFSFGTNDLTQMTFGISRDDAQEAFLNRYLAEGVLATDPFVTLDIEGVGMLVEMAARNGRAARPDLEVGICGEHGGDPKTIAFCQKIGLDYVSCSPPRVPIARLAAAQAALGSGAENASV